jgi:hypothetical protein
MRKTKEPAWVDRYLKAKAKWEEAEAWRERLGSLAPKALEVLEGALDEATGLDPERRAKLAVLVLRLAMSAWPEEEPSATHFALRASLEASQIGDGRSET